MKYQVFDNDKPADCYHHSVSDTWNRSKFNTLKEARQYAMNWLGRFWAPDFQLEPNTPYDYSGHGDKIEIRTVDLEEESK